MAQERVDASNTSVYAEIENLVMRFLLRESLFFKCGFYIPGFKYLQVFTPTGQETGDSFLRPTHLSLGFPDFH